MIWWFDCCVLCLCSLSGRCGFGLRDLNGFCNSDFFDSWLLYVYYFGIFNIWVPLGCLDVVYGCL